jgi:hypothetical protein
MTSIEKLIVKFIDDKFGFPYLDYSREEQTWSSEFFLYDIKTGVMYVSDEVKFTLYKKFGKGYMENVIVDVMSAWFKQRYKHTIKSIE